MTINQKIDAAKYLGYFPDYDAREIDWGILDTPDADTVFERLTAAQKERVAGSLGYQSTVTAYYYTNLGAQDPHKRVVTDFTQGVVTDYQNKDIYWGESGAPAANATFASLSDAQKQIVAASLGYDMLTGVNYYKADAVLGEQIKHGFLAGQTYDYDVVDWGGVGQPSDAYASFEALTFSQREFVAQSLGYEQYNGSVFYNANIDSDSGDQALRTGFTEGEGNDYQVADLAWGDAGEPAPGSAWADLSTQQQNTVLASLGYIRFEGQIGVKMAIYVSASSRVSKTREPQRQVMTM